MMTSDDDLAENGRVKPVRARRIKSWQEGARKQHSVQTNPMIRVASPQSPDTTRGRRQRVLRFMALVAAARNNWTPAMKSSYAM